MSPGGREGRAEAAALASGQELAGCVGEPRMGMAWWEASPRHPSLAGRADNQK